jgi:hypothetical protein
MSKKAGNNSSKPNLTPSTKPSDVKPGNRSMPKYESPPPAPRKK